MNAALARTAMLILMATVPISAAATIHPNDTNTRATGVASLEPQLARFTEYPLGGNAGPYDLVSGPSGKELWFTEALGNHIGRISTSGRVTLFVVPTPGAFPYSITVGPDGALWFVEFRRGTIGRITTAGKITEYPLGQCTTPVGIVAGARWSPLVYVLL